MYQDLAKINLAVSENTLKEELVLKNALIYAKNNQKSVHLLGLVSDGGVHSHINHLEGLVDICEKMKLEKVFLHLFTDGRDVDPKSGLGFIEKIDNKIKKTEIKIASIIGRYFSMDRDNRWERIHKAYDLISNGKGKKTENFSNEIKESYANNKTDEFIEPLVKLNKNGNPIHQLNPDDTIIFFNYRSDRGLSLIHI